jgi:hypothetical protein
MVCLLRRARSAAAPRARRAPRRPAAPRDDFGELDDELRVQAQVDPAPDRPLHAGAGVRVEAFTPERAVTVARIDGVEVRGADQEAVARSQARQEMDS